MGPSKYQNGGGKIDAALVQHMGKKRIKFNVLI